MSRLCLRSDGASRGNPGPAAAAFVLLDDGHEVAHGSRYLGRRTNNEAEYQALIDGLEAARSFRPERLEVLLDSELLVKQLSGRYRVRDARLKPLWERARALLAGFPQVEVRHVPRGLNRRADALANAALDAADPKTRCRDASQGRAPAPGFEAG